MRMDPQDDGGYAYIHKVGSRKGMKLLSPDEQVTLRELLLADGQLGKKVGRNGVDEEGYVVHNTFPRMNELNKFFASLSSEEIDSDTFYSMNVKKGCCRKQGRRWLPPSLFLTEIGQTQTTQKI